MADFRVSGEEGWEGAPSRGDGGGQSEQGVEYTEREEGRKGWRKGEKGGRERKRKGSSTFVS